MADIDFSVIIPVYNVENYLIESFNSVVNQNYTSLEVILIDDGSTDSSGIVCDQLSNEYDFVTVIHQKNKGLSVARNTGILSASGRYIVFLDSDDKLSDNALFNLKKVIVRYNNPDYIISRRQSITENGNLVDCRYMFPIEKLEIMSRSNVYTEIQSYPDFWMGPWIFTVSSKYINNKQLLFYPGIIHEDEEWIPRVFFGGGSIAFNNSLLYVNRPDRQGSLTSVLNIKRLFDLMIIVERLGQYFTTWNYDDDVLICIRNRRASIVFGVITAIRKYKDSNRLDELLAVLRKNIFLLKESDRIIYKITYIFVRLFGILNMSMVIGMIRK